MSAQPHSALPPSMPRSAAVSGVLFALLYGAALLMVRLAVPGAITERGVWLARDASTLALALHLLAYAGIAFLWFMGVVRTHIGAREDRFLSTVYTGSGFLFLAMTFAAAAATAALLGAYAELGESIYGSGIYAFGSRVAFEFANVYAVRMAGVFMISLSTLGLRSGTIPRALAFASFAIAAVLLLSIAQTRWVALLFPLWVLGFSLYLLRHRPPAAAAAA